MKRSRHAACRGGAVAALALALLASSCVATSDPPPPAVAGDVVAGPTLSLVAAEQTATELVVDVLYARKAGEPGPRMVELHLGLAGGLQYHASEGLDAAEAAGKAVVVQPQPDGAVRVVVFATANTTRLASGGLVRLWLGRIGGAGEAVTLLERRPVFAPADAEAVAVLGPPLVVGGAP